MHGEMRIGNRVNTKVMGYDLRDLDHEMKKSLKFYLNKRIKLLEISIT